jgi:hypothetical protein
MKTPPVLSGAVLVLAIVALSSFPLPALAEPDNDSPCWMYDPIGGDCTGGGGNGGCKDCVIMNNPYTDDSYCTCATVQNGGYQICNAPSGDRVLATGWARTPSVSGTRRGKALIRLSSLSANRVRMLFRKGVACAENDGESAGGGGPGR